MNPRLSLLKPSFPALFMLVFTLLFTVMAQAQGQLNSTVDRTQVTIEETFKLNVRYNEQVMFGEPDFSELKLNFDILGSNRSNQYRNINGQTESWTQWTLTLAPKKEGKLLIPSFEYEGSYSDAIEMTVSQTPTVTGTHTDKPIYIETEISKDKAFVQEQLLYTIRLYTSVNLSGLDRGDLTIDHALIKQVAENQYQKTINGQPYGVVETTYAIFPQQSGTLTIPPTLWTVTEQNTQGYRYDPFLSRGGQRLRLRTEGDSVDILPKPGNYTGDQWLPATSVELRQSWSEDPDNFKVGEPITRTLTIDAKGLMASQLAPLTLDEVNGVKYYPDQPQADESISASGINTLKTESYAIVPSQAGDITLPAVSITWWDTQNNRMQEASLPVQTIHVSESAASPATQQSTAQPAASPQTGALPSDTASKSLPGSPFSSTEAILNAAQMRGLWFYTTVLLAFTTLFFAMLWLTARRKPRTPTTPKPIHNTQKTTEKQAYSRLKQALQGSDPQSIRKALLMWASLYLNNPNLSSLHQLSEIWPPLSDSLTQLEASLYGQSATEFNTQELQQTVADLRRSGIPASTTEADGSLPPLYS